MRVCIPGTCLPLGPSNERLAVAALPQDNSACALLRPPEVLRLRYGKNAQTRGSLRGGRGRGRLSYPRSRIRGTGSRTTKAPDHEWHSECNQGI